MRKSALFTATVLSAVVLFNGVANAAPALPGTLKVLSSAQMPAAAVLTPGATRVALAAFDFVAMREPMEVNKILFNATTGGANALENFVLEDAAGNLLARAGRVSAGGDVTFGGRIAIPRWPAVTTLFVKADVRANPSTVRFRLAIPRTNAVTALGVQSRRPVAALGAFPLYSNIFAYQDVAHVEVTVSPLSPRGDVVGGPVEQFLFAFQVTAVDDEIVLSRVRAQILDGVPEGVFFGPLYLVGEDAGALRWMTNVMYDVPADGTLEFAFENEQIIPRGVTKTYYINGVVGGNFEDGLHIGFSIPNPQAITAVRRSTGAPARIEGQFPLIGATLTLYQRGELEVSLVPLYGPAPTINPGPDVPLMTVRLTSRREEFQIAEVTFRALTGEGVLPLDEVRLVSSDGTVMARGRFRTNPQDRQEYSVRFQLLAPPSITPLVPANGYIDLTLRATVIGPVPREEEVHFDLYMTENDITGIGYYSDAFVNATGTFPIRSPGIEAFELRY